MQRRFLLFLMLATMISMPSLAPAALVPAAIGFDYLHLPDGTEVGVWYPASGKPVSQVLGLWAQETVPGTTPVGSKLPLIVMSHGSGGSFAEHVDTAMALARAGFVVAALTHPGDNWQDQSQTINIARRPAALEALIDFMLGQWRYHGVIDPARIGAFGFSSGGFSVLAAAGGKPDLALMASHCAAHPNFYDCGLIKAGLKAAAPWPGFHDKRIRALVVAAPALGFTFGRGGLSAVKVPVQLWRAGDDHVLPAPYYADAVRADLPAPPEFHNVPGANHLDFVAPCVAGFEHIPACVSAPGFDRAAFHKQFNADVVRFFVQQLG